MSATTNGRVNGVVEEVVEADAARPVNRLAVADGINGPGKDATTGRFLPGNTFGHGNPNYRKLAANRAAVLQAVTPDAVGKLAKKLLRRALDGDLAAAKIIFAYAVGRPDVAADPDIADRLEFEGMAGAPDLLSALATRFSFAALLAADRKSVV